MRWQVETSVRPDQFLCDAAGEGRLRFRVDDDRVSALVLDFGGSAVAFDDGLRELDDTRPQELANLRIEGADAERELRIFRDHVYGVARMDRPDGDDRGLGRIDIPRHDGLKRDDEVAGDHHGVDGQMGTRGMAAHPPDGDIGGIGRGHHRAGAQKDVAFRRAGMVVQAEDRVEGKPLEQAVGDHRLGAAEFTGLFGRLEDQGDGAIEAAGAGKILGRTQQHRRMSVMSAGMHLAETLLA